MPVALRISQMTHGADNSQHRERGNDCQDPWQSDIGKCNRREHDDKRGDCQDNHLSCREVALIHAPYSTPARGGNRSAAAVRPCRPPVTLIRACRRARVARATAKRPLTPDPSPARGEGSRVDEREQGQHDCRAAGSPRCSAAEPTNSIMKATINVYSGDMTEDRVMILTC
jgi:hypothetical protein